MATRTGKIPGYKGSLLAYRSADSCGTPLCRNAEKDFLARCLCGRDDPLPCPNTHRYHVARFIPAWRYMHLLPAIASTFSLRFLPWPYLVSPGETVRFSAGVSRCQCANACIASKTAGDLPANVFGPSHNPCPSPVLRRRIQTLILAHQHPRPRHGEEAAAPPHRENAAQRFGCAPSSMPCLSCRPQEGCSAQAPSLDFRRGSQRQPDRRAAQGSPGADSAAVAGQVRRVNREYADGQAADAGSEQFDEGSKRRVRGTLSAGSSAVCGQLAARDDNTEPKALFTAATVHLHKFMTNAFTT